MNTTANAWLSHVSDTALITARIRGHESLRSDRLFNDPLAYPLAGERGERLANEGRKRIVQRLLASTMRSSVVVRTVLIDGLIERAISERDIGTVVNLGAGLDTRPYRLKLKQSLLWIEADLAPMIEYKTRITSSETPRCRLERIAADLTNRTEVQSLLHRAGADKKPVLVLTEGLLLYLSESQVGNLADDLRSHPQIETWITDMYSPVTLKSMARAWRAQLGQDVKFNFGTTDSQSFFSGLGWSVNHELPVFEHSARLNRESSLAVVRKTLCRVFGDRLQKKFHKSSVILELGRM